MKITVSSSPDKALDLADTSLDVESGIESEPVPMKLINLMDWNFESCACSGPVLGGSRKISYEKKCKIYTISELSTLRDEIKELSTSQKVDDEYKYKARYYVDAGLVIWFAKEGTPSSTIPAHYQMTGETSGSARAVIAGTIEFSTDFSSIVGINNKSGDFQPAFEQLKWAMAVLLANEETLSVPLADKVRISKSCSDEGYLPLDLRELRTWIQSHLGDVELKGIGNQPRETRTVNYVPDNAGMHSLFAPAVKKQKLDLFFLYRN